MFANKKCNRSSKDRHVTGFSWYMYWHNFPDEGSEKADRCRNMRVPNTIANEKREQAIKDEKAG